MLFSLIQFQKFWGFLGNAFYYFPDLFPALSSKPQSLRSSRNCRQITGIPYISTPRFPEFGEHHSASPALKHSGYAKEASPEGLGLVSWFGTSLITLWFLQCPRMAANHQQSIIGAPCRRGLCQPPRVSLGFCASFQLCEKPVLELGRGKSWGGGHPALPHGD